MGAVTGPGFEALMVLPPTVPLPLRIPPYRRAVALAALPVAVALLHLPIFLVSHRSYLPSSPSSSD